MSHEILIAEDSLTQATRLQHILEAEGYRVTHALNGRLALEAARSRKPALIVSDVVMPEMDGYEFCRSVKSDPALCEIPFILVTTLADPHDVIRGLECRADNFVPKPYDERFLLSRVKLVLLNREVRQAEGAGMGIEVIFNGQRHFITADRLQILNLLLSTYEAAVERNEKLSRTQDDLRQLNARLESANKELEAFSYSVSHDLRAPLRHVHAFSELLATNTAGRLDEKSARYLKTISDSALKMDQLIDDLLDFSRMGRAEIRRTTLDLNALLKQVVGALELETKGRKIAWKLDPLPTVQADPSMMRQVFANLVSNALKYTRTREVAEITVGTSGSAQEVVVFVRDNGVGFDMAYSDRLFGVFQRLHAADKFEGTGVGLANVRRIVTRHGGATWAEAKENEGATFYFSLPKFSEGIPVI